MNWIVLVLLVLLTLESYLVFYIVDKSPFAIPVVGVLALTCMIFFVQLWREVWNNGKMITVMHTMAIEKVVQYSFLIMIIIFLIDLNGTSLFVLFLATSFEKKFIIVSFVVSYGVLSMYLNFWNLLLVCKRKKKRPSDNCTPRLDSFEMQPTAPMIVPIVDDDDQESSQMINRIETNEPIMIVQIKQD
jgi:hypothetical protein